MTNTSNRSTPSLNQEQAALKDMYAKVIQMSSENKITSKNAWYMTTITPPPTPLPPKHSHTLNNFPIKVAQNDRPHGVGP